MTVTPLGNPALGASLDVPAALDVPDVARARGNSAGSAASIFAGAVGKAFDAAATSLRRADDAERAFASGSGGLQELVLERAQADVALSIASAAASRSAQALTTILGMQV